MPRRWSSAHRTGSAYTARARSSASQSDIGAQLVEHEAGAFGVARRRSPCRRDLPSGGRPGPRRSASQSSGSGRTARSGTGSGSRPRRRRSGAHSRGSKRRRTLACPGRRAPSLPSSCSSRGRRFRAGRTVRPPPASGERPARRCRVPSGRRAGKRRPAAAIRSPRPRPASCWSVALLAERFSMDSAS